MELRRINPNTITRGGKLENCITAFMNDSSIAVEITGWQSEYTNGKCMYNSIRQTIQRLSLSDKVQISKKGDHYYLIKIKEDK